MTANQRTSTDRQAQWIAPGPGSWVRDRSHGPPNPTPLFRRIASEHTTGPYAEAMEEFGGAIGTIDFKFVHGSLYRRLVPLVGAKFDRGAPPPNPILWLVTRIHPAFRKRERTARTVMIGNPFQLEVDNWPTERRVLIAENLRLSAIAPESLDRISLADHISYLDDHLVAGWWRHHKLHASDLGAIGDLLVHTNDWAMNPVEVMGLLKGASVSTVEAARHGRDVASALLANGVNPETIETIDQINAVPEAKAALADYLEEFGWRIVTSYDLEGRTLVELPGTICSLVRSAGEALADGTARESFAASQDQQDQVLMTEAQLEHAGTLAKQTPDPELFLELLDRARGAYGLRDDNGPLTWEWPVGLMRRAYLAAAATLASEDELPAPNLVFELDADELVEVLRGDRTFTKSELEQRASLRKWEADQDGPDFFGPPPPADPDLSALPAALARIMSIIVAATTMLDPVHDKDQKDLSGLGIGTEVYRGRARVVNDVNQAIVDMAPGEVLVVAWTAPSFNAVLSIAGAAVVQEGGLLCHAAVMARELNIPAVVGCINAMTAINSGDLVEVDPAAGTVRIVNDTADGSDNGTDRP